MSVKHKSSLIPSAAWSHSRWVFLLCPQLQEMINYSQQSYYFWDRFHKDSSSNCSLPHIQNAEYLLIPVNLLLDISNKNVMFLIWVPHHFPACCWLASTPIPCHFLLRIPSEYEKYAWTSLNLYPTILADYPTSGQVNLHPDSKNVNCRCSLAILPNSSSKFSLINNLKLATISYPLTIHTSSSLKDIWHGFPYFD